MSDPAKRPVSGERTLQIHRLGRVEYEDGLGLMGAAAGAIRLGAPPDMDYLFLVEHPPLFTFGRRVEAANLRAARGSLVEEGFEFYETDRGGNVTYHGPGQVVGYPVIDLSDRRDVRGYVATLEEAMIRTCADYALRAGRHPVHRGAWIGGKKIGAVGVHLSRWISSHGFAFNVSPDLGHFRHIVPCGIAEPGLGVTSLAAELEALGRAPPALPDVEVRLATHLAALLGRRREDRSVDLRTVSVVVTGSDGRVLLLRRTEARGGFWQPVTGRMERGEVPAVTARRELFEETGADLEVQPLGYRHAFALDPSRLGEPAAATLVTAEETAFVARAPPGFECRRSLEEHSEHGWFTLEEALELLRFAGLRRAVRLATAGSHGEASCPVAGDRH